MSQPKWDYVCSEYVYNFDPPGSGRVWWGRIGAKWYWLHVEPWSATPDATRLILAAGEKDAIDAAKGWAASWAKVDFGGCSSGSSPHPQEQPLT
jgi:hypothetical protein